jgi:hypothetical protein
MLVYGLLITVYFLGVASAYILNWLHKRPVVTVAPPVEHDTWTVPDESISTVLKEWRRLQTYSAEGNWDLWAAIRKAIPDLPKNRELYYHISSINQAITITGPKPAEG